MRTDDDGRSLRLIFRARRPSLSLYAARQINFSSLLSVSLYIYRYIHVCVGTRGRELLLMGCKSPGAAAAPHCFDDASNK